MFAFILNVKNKEIPVIFVPVKTEIEDIVRGFQVGSVGYIAKPFIKRRPEFNV